MTTAATALIAYDSRPFFDKALRYGVTEGIIASARLQAIETDFAKGIVQIAHYFGTAHLRPELELALHRMVNLLSLYLEDLSGSDLAIAATALRDKSLLSLSKGGSDMLRRLHAMPESTLLGGNPVSPEDQRAYLDEKTAATAVSLADYREAIARRQENQNTLGFASWLARKLGASGDGFDDAEPLIRSAMLVVFVERAALRMPTRTAFVGLVKAAKAPKAKLDEKRLLDLVKDAPVEFQRLAQRAMARFIADDLPQLRDARNSADKLLYGEAGQAYFVNENLDEDVREYDRLVAKEWDRVTRGKADDPAVLATVLLFIATALPPKASMLLKEAREVTRIFRATGFDTAAVLGYIEAQAPAAERDDLARFWQDDLREDAQQHLADTDPNWPDTHMDRALDYLRRTCNAAWKGRR